MVETLGSLHLHPLTLTRLFSLPSGSSSCVADSPNTHAVPWLACAHTETEPGSFGGFVLGLSPWRWHRGVRERGRQSLMCPSPPVCDRWSPPPWFYGQAVKPASFGWSQRPSDSV